MRLTGQGRWNRNPIRRRARQHTPHASVHSPILALYRLLTWLLAPLIALLLLVACCGAKYRSRIPARLGFGLRRSLIPALDANPGPVIWLHALSVGEVTSCGPLLRGLRAARPDAALVLSVATKSGEAVARARFAGLGGAIVAAPYDLPPVVGHFLNVIRPALFIQIETDFWPGWLAHIRKAGVPAFLVNGRITARSFARYRRGAVLFAPMFDCFTGLAMQTRADAANMRALGLAPEKIHVLGNLKFDAAEAGKQSNPEERSALRASFGFAAPGRLLVLASTHPGEEALLLPVLARLRETMPDLQILLAPRHPARAEEVAALAETSGLRFRRRSEAGPGEAGGPLLLLDTLGELAGCMSLADLVFVGGSLAPFGGHNPVEAAAWGLPVCFGPHMEDFAEIAQALLEAGGAVRLTPDALHTTLTALLTDADRCRRMGAAARTWLDAQQGVVRRHLALMLPHLAAPSAESYF